MSKTVQISKTVPLKPNAQQTKKRYTINSSSKTGIYFFSCDSSPSLFVISIRSILSIVYNSSTSKKKITKKSFERTFSCYLLVIF